MNHVMAWLYCRSGATAIEYGLLAGGISLSIAATVFVFGSDLKVVFETVDSTYMAGVSSNVAAG